MPTCPLCGTEYTGDKKFCGSCGNSLSGSLSGNTGRLATDTVLEDRYVIIRTIGRGGMGAVYLALDKRLENRAVAVKEMSTNAIGGGNLEAAVTAFKQEASMLISLKHQSLPTIYDFFSRSKERWYLVMDYIEGKTLKEVMRERGKIPEAEVVEWARQLCDILGYLHSRRPPVIFRDLKPANIMLTTDGTIKLIDFGIARHFHPGATADTAAYGSVGFAPPEQYGQEQTNVRSDIYALGATMHFLLTGSDPDSNPFTFDPPSKLTKVSLKLEKAIMQALEFRPEKRPASVAEMLALLPISAPVSALAQGTMPLVEGDGFDLEDTLAAKTSDKKPELPKIVNYTVNPDQEVKTQVLNNIKTTAITPKNWVKPAAVAAVIVLLAVAWVGMIKLGIGEQDRQIQVTPAPLNETDRALVEAVRKGDSARVKQALAVGAKVNAADTKGWTPLISASFKGDISIVNILLEAGADVNAANNDGQTALILAPYNRHTEVIQLLLKAGANINAQDVEGDTALYHAAFMGNYSAVKELVESGAKLELKNKQGKTPLMIAEKLSQQNISQLLIKAGAKE